MTNRVAVECTYSDGNKIRTEINGSMETAKQYFLGNAFNIGSVTDNMQQCIAIKEIR
jgi:hypothetical protein